MLDADPQGFAECQTDDEMGLKFGIQFGVTGVPQHQPVLRIIETQAVRHGVHRLADAAQVGGSGDIGHDAQCAADTAHQQKHHADQHTHGGWRQAAVVKHGGVGNHGDGRHADEVQHHDGQRQTGCGHQQIRDAAALVKEGCRPADDHGADNGRRDQAEVPGDVGRTLDRGHAEIVHRADAGDGDHRRHHPPGGSLAQLCRADREPDHGQGDRQGRQCQTQIVANRHAGDETLHGDEMRRPDRQGADDRGHDDGAPPGAGITRRRPLHEPRRNANTDHADQRGQQCDPPVVIARNTEDDAVHEVSPWRHHGRKS